MSKGKLFEIIVIMICYKFNFEKMKLDCVFCLKFKSVLKKSKIFSWNWSEKNINMKQSLYMGTFLLEIKLQLKMKNNYKYVLLLAIQFFFELRKGIIS